MERQMTAFSEQAKLGIRAAVADTARNILHPIRNIGVVFGFVQEDSLSEIIRKTAKKEKQPSDPQPTLR